MRIYFYLFTMALLSACHPRQYSIVRNFRRTENHKTITLDSSFKFFVREIYKDSSGHFSLNSKKPSVTSFNKKLLEIEYLLYSEEQKKVAYITTVPDRFQERYSVHRIADKTLINAFDFNTFHFGKITIGKEEIQFRDQTDSSKTYTWQFKVLGDSLSIERILETKDGIYQNERSVKNSILHGAVFRRVPKFEIVMKNYSKANTDTLRMLTQQIYLMKRRKEYDIYLQFEDLIPRKTIFINHAQRQRKEYQFRENREFNTIIFKGSKRIPFSPELVL